MFGRLEDRTGSLMGKFSTTDRITVNEKEQIAAVGRQNLDCRSKSSTNLEKTEEILDKI